MPKTDWFQKYAAHNAMLIALEAGTASSEQQKAAFDHLKQVKRQHNEDIRDAERDARDAYSEGRHEGISESQSNYY